MSTHNRATSTSNTVTTSQAGHKRPRELETDSKAPTPQTKRTRVQIGSSTQGVSESSCGEVEYQVPTSSQRDQDDDNIIVVDSGEDDEMPDEGPVEPDDAPFEDDGAAEMVIRDSVVAIAKTAIIVLIETNWRCLLLL